MGCLPFYRYAFMEPTPPTDPRRTTPSAPPRRKTLVWVLAAVGALLALGVLAVVWVASSIRAPRLSEDAVRQAIHATLQREAPASFLVTGELDLTATATVRSTRYLLPDLLRLRLGSASATVRLPARASYGFDVGELRAESIRVTDSVIEVAVPELRVYAVDANLSAMEVRTEEGWRAISPSSEPARKEALERVEEAIRAQAAAHLQDSSQPRVNTARALEAMLRPPLEAAGVRNPRFSFLLGGRLRVEPG